MTLFRSSKIISSRAWITTVRGKHEREAQCIFWTIYTNGVNIHHKALSKFSNINYVHTNGLRNQVRRRCRFDHSSHFPWDLLIWLSDRDRAFTNQNYDFLQTQHHKAHTNGRHHIEPLQSIDARRKDEVAIEEVRASIQLRCNECDYWLLHSDGLLVCWYLTSKC